MSKHTPGPWMPRRAVKPDNTGGYDWAIIAPDKAIVAECFEVVDWAENGVDFDTRPVEANARLIASAPDLLETLQQLEYWFNTDAEILDAMTDAERADHIRQHEKIRKAIAKALGEQS